MSVSVIEAWYETECGDCGRRIKRGTRITVRDHEWCHEVCPDDPGKLVGTACTVCFQERSVSGACGCIA